jgi:threonine dehydratase
LLTLTDEQRAAGVVAVSGGNHGVAVAEMSAALGVRATVVMPRTAPARSGEIARAAGTDVRLAPTMAEAFALMERLEADGLTLLHPLADPVVIAGQSTVGLELAADAGPLTDILVSIGGGGLIAGVAAALRAVRPGVRVWGVETTGADAMTQALAHGGPVQVDVGSRITTLGAPTVSPLTYTMVHDLFDEVLVVPEAEAFAAVREMAEHAKVWTEPAASCLPAASSPRTAYGPASAWWSAAATPRSSRRTRDRPRSAPVGHCLLQLGERSSLRTTRGGELWRPARSG